MNSWDRRVIEQIDQDTDELIEFLAKLVRIPSVGGSEAECDIQRVVADWMTSEGFDVDQWDIPIADLAVEPDFCGAEVERSGAIGVVGKLHGRGGDGHSLMFNGHVDVVPPGESNSWEKASPFGGTVIDDIMYGRGTCDMKGGLVSALFAANALRRIEAPLRGDLLVASVAGEEDGGLGTYALLRHGWRADACIIPEPTGLDIVPANGGALTFRLRVPGLAIHASRRTLGVSAVERFMKVFASLRNLEQQRNDSVDSLMKRWDIAYPIEVGMVTAGDWSSSVPGQLVAEGRFGVALGEPVAQAKKSMEQTVSELNEQNAWTRDHPVTIEWWGGQFASGRLIEPDGGLVAHVRTAHQSVQGRPCDQWGAPYGSDLRLFTNIGGIPTIQYGPGNISVAHGPDEHIDLAEVRAASKVMALTALTHCGIDE